MKKNITILLFLFSGLFVKAQTITFSGCPNFFGGLTYTFNKTGTDATGRNIYETTPIGDQACPMGNCDFRIYWSTANSRWEFIADSGNGDFVDPYLIYHNTSASTPNPPSITLGVWIENSTLTNGDCGGNLTSGNSSLIGAVQNVLGKDDFVIDNSITLTPNPVSNTLRINTPNRINQAFVYSIQGQKISEIFEANEIDFSNLRSGMYLVKIVSEKGIKVQSIIRQ